jgi:vacuolar-type H+-ATPase subunit D/Vma8
MAKRSGGGLAEISVADLKRELTRRQRGVDVIVKKRERLVAKLRELDSQISELGGRYGSGGFSVRKRPKNESNLVEALAGVLNGKTMSVTEVTEAVQKAGYQTTSPSFRTIVNQTLINSGKFKRVSRGQYTAK